MQIKTAETFYIHQTAKIQLLAEMEQRGISAAAGMKQQYGILSSTLKGHLPYYLAVLLAGTQPRETKHLDPGTRSVMITASLFTISQK